MAVYNEVCHLQRAQTAFAAHDYTIARHWFELVRTWSPASVAAPLAACEAVSAAVGSAATAAAMTTAAQLPPADLQQVFASPVRTSAGMCVM